MCGGCLMRAIVLIESEDHMPAQTRLFLCLKDNFGVLLHDPESGATAAIDAPEAAPVEAALKSTGWRLSDILVTHHHADHTGGIVELKQRHRCRVTAPHGEAARIPLVDATVRENDEVRVGSLRGRVLETPGHTAGHISYVFPADKLAFVGDTLFSIGCGRVIEGTPEMMWQSLLKLRALPDDTRIYCGHEYTKANVAFAKTVEPDNAALRARDRGRQTSRRAGADHPVDHGRGKGGKPVSARGRAGGGEIGRACGQPGVEGVRGNPRAQEQVLTL